MTDPFSFIRTPKPTPIASVGFVSIWRKSTVLEIFQIVCLLRIKPINSGGPIHWRRLSHRSFARTSVFQKTAHALGFSRQPKRIGKNVGRKCTEI